MSALKKPHVICHMMSSLDGRLDTEAWSSTSGVSPGDRAAEYERVHEELGADAWLSGRVTMAEFATSEAHSPSKVGKPERPNHFVQRDADGYAIAVDTLGKLHWTSGDIDGDHVVVFRLDDFDQGERTSHGEIAEVGWFSPSALPADTNRGCRARLAEIFDGAPVDPDW